MKRIVPPPPPPQTIKKGPGGCALIIGVPIALATVALILMITPTRADTCRLPVTVTCTLLMCQTCDVGADGNQYCASGSVTACNTCTPDPALYTCTRADGTTYSVPAFVSGLARSDVTSRPAR